MVTSWLRLVSFFLVVAVTYTEHLHAMLHIKHHFSDEAPASPRIIRHASLPPATNRDEPAPIRSEDELRLLKELHETLAYSEQVHIVIFNDCKEDLFLSIKDPFGNDYHQSLIIKTEHEISFDILAGAPLLLKAMPLNTPNPKFYTHKIDNNFSNITTNISTWTPPSLRGSPLRFASHQNVLSSPTSSATSSPRSSSPELPRSTSSKRANLVDQGSHSTKPTEEDN